MKASKAKVTKTSGPKARSGATQSASSAAAAYSTPLRVKEPRILSTNSKKGTNRSTRIVHRELITDIDGSVSFGVGTALSLNPGISTTFPWLSTQASGWEQYRFHRLDFEYITRSPTTATGSVYLAPDYDTLDSEPGTEQQIATYRDTTEDAPWKDQCCQLDPSAMFPIGPRKYIRSGLVGTSDLKTYDAGRMYVATTGQAGTDGIGKLWVSYDVEFFVPQTVSSGEAASRTMSMFNLSSTQALTSGVEATVAFDETIVNSLGIVNTTGSFVLPHGAWEILAEVQCATTTISDSRLEIKKNGSALSPPMLTAPTGASPIEPLLHVLGFVTSNGTDAVTIRITLVGTGVSVAGDQCRVAFRTV